MNEIMEEMLGKGIGAALVKNDGSIVATTLAFKEVEANLIKMIASGSDSMMKKSNDSTKEIEIAFDGLLLVIIPIKDHYFCGLIKNREEKKLVQEYAKRAAIEL